MGWPRGRAGVGAWLTGGRSPRLVAADGEGGGGVVGAVAFGDGAALLGLEACEGAAFVGGGVEAEAVGSAAFVVLG